LSPSAGARSPPLPDPIAFPQDRISDGVVALRLKRDDDVGALVAACQDPEIPRYTRVPSPYGEEDAREWIEISEAARMAGTMLSVLVVDRRDRLLGSVGLHDIDQRNRRAEIGYWTAAEARGAGVTVRGVRLLARHAFETLALERIGISVEVGNERSCRVAERAGFRREGVLRGWINVSGVQRDGVMFSLLRGEPDR